MTTPNVVACPDCRGVHPRHARLSVDASGKRTRVLACAGCRRETPIPVKDAPGCPCPRCGDTRMKTVKTSHRKGQTVRVRKCRSCAHRIRTREVVESYAA